MTHPASRVHSPLRLRPSAALARRPEPIRRGGARAMGRSPFARLLLMLVAVWLAAACAPATAARSWTGRG